MGSRLWRHFKESSLASIRDLPTQYINRAIPPHPILFQRRFIHCDKWTYAQWQSFRNRFRNQTPSALGGISRTQPTWACSTNNTATAFNSRSSHPCSSDVSPWQTLQSRTISTLSTNIRRGRVILQNIKQHYIIAHCSHDNQIGDAAVEDRDDQVDVIKFIKDNTELTQDHLTPEIQLHLLTKKCDLWYGPVEESPILDPFWAFYWPGGQALTRYLLDNPSVVQGKRVLDVGSGCGASAIAAVKLGASHVLANDIDPVAEIAIQLNCEANDVQNLQVCTDNLIGGLEDQWDVILFGDVFYDDEFTNQVTNWIEALQPRPTTILIGDPGRVYFKNNPIRSKLKLVYEFELPQHLIEENNGLTHGYVWQYNSDKS